MTSMKYRVLTFITNMQPSACLLFICSYFFFCLSFHPLLCSTNYLRRIAASFTQPQGLEVGDEAYETTKTAWRLAFIFHFWFTSLENLESDTKYSWHISLKNRSYLGYFLYKTQTPKLVSCQYPESSACCTGLHIPCLIISPCVIRQLWVADHV